MRWMILRGVVVALAGLVLSGCASLQHEPAEVVGLGDEVSVVVSSAGGLAETARGQVHVLKPGERRYASQPLTWHEGKLRGSISTAGLMAGDLLLYHIDVVADGERQSLGSAVSPFKVKVLSRRQYLEHHVKREVFFTDERGPVSFKVQTGELDVLEAAVYCQMEATGRSVRGEMRKVYNIYRFDVPREEVVAGTWRYFIVLTLGGGDQVRLPEAAFETFTVRSYVPPR